MYLVLNVNETVVQRYKKLRKASFFKTRETLTAGMLEDKVAIYSTNSKIIYTLLQAVLRQHTT